MVLHPDQHVTGRFGDEPFQAVNCTDTHNWKQKKAQQHIHFNTV